MERPADNRSAPGSAEAQALARGIRRLKRAVDRELWGADSVADAAMVYELLEYAELLEQAYASGFVQGRPVTHEGFDFDAINARPQGQLSDPGIRRDLPVRARPLPGRATQLGLGKPGAVGHPVRSARRGRGTPGDGTDKTAPFNPLRLPNAHLKTGWPCHSP